MNITVIDDKTIKDVDIEDFDPVIREVSLDAISKVLKFRNKYLSIKVEEDPAGLFVEHLRQFAKTKRIPTFPSEKRMLVSDRVYKYITDLNTLQDDFFFSRFNQYLITRTYSECVCVANKSVVDEDKPKIFSGVTSYLIPPLNKVHLFEHNFASSEIGEYIFKVLSNDSNWKFDLADFKSKFEDFFASIVKDQLDSLKRLSPEYLVEKFIAADDLFTARQVLSEFSLTSDFKSEMWDVSDNEELLHQFLLSLEKLVTSSTQDSSCKFSNINLSVLKLVNWENVSDKDRTRAINLTIKYNEVFSDTFGISNSNAFSDFNGIPNNISQLLLNLVTEESIRFFATEFYKKLEGREKSSNIDLTYKSSVVFTKEQIRKIFNLKGESFSLAISLKEALNFLDELPDLYYYSQKGTVIKSAFFSEFNKLGRMKIYSRSSKGVFISKEAFLKDINFLLEQVKKATKDNNLCPVNIIASESTKEDLLQALKLLQSANYRPEIITDDFISLLQKQMRETVYINI